MTGKMIVFSVIVLIVMLAIYLFYDSGLMKGLKKSQKTIDDTLNRVREKKEVELVNGPILHIRNEGEKRYHTVPVNNKVFKIGRGEKNNLILDSKKVEGKHAIIYKKLKDDYVYYELVNYSKINPVEYLNKQKNKYEYLGYKDGVELDAHEVFYIGDTKTIITIPAATHTPSDTEYGESSFTESKTKTAIYEKNRIVSERIIRKYEIDI